MKKILFFCGAVSMLLFLIACSPEVQQEDLNQVDDSVVQEELANELETRDDSEDESESNFEEVLTIKQVVVNLPDDWEEEMNFFENDERNRITYHHKDDVFGKPSYEGLIIKEQIANPDDLTLQEYFDAQQSECLELNPVPENMEDGEILYIPCIKVDVEMLDDFVVDGVTVYRSIIDGIPESGEEAEYIYIPFDDRFVFLMAVYDTPTVEARNHQFEVVDGIFDKFEIVDVRGE